MEVLLQIILSVVAVIAVVKIRRFIKCNQRRSEWKKAGRDVVILHGLSQGIYTPSVSPFVMKLATYLRMAEIDHKMEFTDPFGPKGKSPWITINGKSIGDSQLIMDFLGSHFKKDFSSDLSDEQKAMAWSLSIMVDEHLGWVLQDWRWIRDGGRSYLNGKGISPSIRTLFLMKRKEWEKQSRMNTQGIGKHSHEDIESFGRRDIMAISRILGNKPFLMGDKPCEVDCSVFGCLVQIAYNYPGSPYKHMLENDYQNLYAYVKRMKERFWPDWDQHLLIPNHH